MVQDFKLGFKCSCFVLYRGGVGVLPQENFNFSDIVSDGILDRKNCHCRNVFN